MFFTLGPANLGASALPPSLGRGSWAFRKQNFTRIVLVLYTYSIVQAKPLA